MTPPDETPAVELDCLSVSYGDRVAVDSVSLAVRRGEILGYLGPNGAGKTSTLSVLAGLLRPSAGTARVAGLDVVESPLEVKRRIGFVPESGAVFLKVTPREHLDLVGRLHGLPRRELARRAERWLTELGLAADADRRLGELSRGARQKTCWAGALLHDPEVLVLDEPLSGLDVSAVSRVKATLSRLAAEGRTVVYSSHLVDVVERTCTRLAILHRGRLVAEGTAAEILARTSTTALDEAMAVLCPGDAGSTDASAAPA